ncbi:alpha/beta hydrolase family protein [Parapedobacter indicus]|uniref:KANL3/Tex30 alpha/beta hydrolase-like domain-containing protein n=1 Tax=Parapedobacter indicus TaxID=1477437 RepID=A0A1I3KUI7_9SPHI|nr:alpha/beta family hydrolase [Parapedobacter indicus]PPL01929.1 hypothetical protein CLV26_105309 [Parapedobacter indicus]SFI76179.1 hypothetical protein SAMN05444682_105309 [Parapedobacter indicus]
MYIQSSKLMVSPSIGTVSAIYTAPKEPECILTLAHGAGAGMNHGFMEALAHSLAMEAIATLRFNFPFSEHGKARPDPPVVAHATIGAAIASAHELCPDLPLFASGKSFGGRMSSQYLAANPESTVRGLIFYGFPLHPAGKPAIDRADHLRLLEIPMLFLQGAKDALATWTLIETVCQSLPTASLVRLEGIDHSFRAGRADIISRLASETRRWTEQR